jgi:pilus assembly protein CpaB
MKGRAAGIAILVASVGAFLLWTYLKRFEQEASGGALVAVLVTVHTLEPGSVLRDEDIGERSIPTAYVEPRAIRAGDRARMVNLRILVPLQAQQTLMWTDIVQANDDKRDLSSLVQPGMRAVTIHVDGKASALVHPGDRVDVIGTFVQPSSVDNKVAVVLLQNILVLGAGGETTGPGGRRNGGEESDLALSLTLQNSQILQVASDKGKLAVALRSPDDIRVQESVADISSSILTQAVARAAVSSGHSIQRIQ